MGININTAPLGRIHGAATASFHAIFSGPRDQLITSGELARLVAIRAELKEMHRQLLTVGHDAPKRARRAAEAAYNANPTNAELFEAYKAATENDGGTLAVRFQAARRAVKEAMRKPSEEAKEILNLVKARAAEIAEAELPKVQAEEARISARIGIPVEDGPAACAMRNLIYELRKPALVGRGSDGFGVLRSLVRDLPPEAAESDSAPAPAPAAEAAPAPAKPGLSIFRRQRNANAGS